MANSMTIEEGIKACRFSELHGDEGDGEALKGAGDEHPQGEAAKEVARPKGGVIKEL